jgi:hypothetical protein
MIPAMVSFLFSLFEMIFDMNGRKQVTRVHIYRLGMEVKGQREEKKKLWSSLKSQKCPWTCEHGVFTELVTKVMNSHVLFPSGRP